MSEQDDNEIAELTEKIRVGLGGVQDYLNRGRAYVRDGDYDKASSDIGYADELRRNPARIDDGIPGIPTYLRRNYYILTYNNGDFYAYDDAIADFTVAIRKNPNDAEAYACRGFAYDRKGDGGQAFADYTESIRLDPNPVKDTHRLNRVNAYWKRGDEYVRKGDYDKAIADYNEVIRRRIEWKLTGGYKIYPVIAETYYSKGDYDNAIAAFTETIKQLGRDSLHLRIYNGRGLAYCHKGDYDNAAADFETALRFDPNDAGAKENLEFAKSERDKRGR
jgi:tetratricopeptide (TPR) repeat protein